MEIVKINQQNLKDMNKANQPFEIIGKISPTFADGIWKYAEELYDRPYMKAYRRKYGRQHGLADGGMKIWAFT